MKNIILAIVIISSIFSCEQNSERIIPDSIGGPGQILIIMEKHKWEQEPGKLIKEAINKDYDVLPQSEPLFDISQIPKKAYSMVLKRNRNILYTQISPNIKKSEVLIAYDKHSKPQIIITIKAKNNEDFIALFNKQKDNIISSFNNAERNRLLKAYRGKLLNKNIKKQLTDNHQIKINIPKGYKLDVDSSNFIWISQETPYSTQGLLIWDYPYLDTSEFHLENLLNKRDSITKKYVPGPADSSYMATERLIPPVYKEFMKNDKYSTEIRGLWKVDGAKGVFMGGPYISVSTADSKRNRIITVDGFVYGGKKKKRELIKQIEAILYSLEISE